MAVIADFAFIAHSVYRHAIVQLLSWQRGGELPSLSTHVVLPSLCHLSGSE